LYVATTWLMRNVFSLAAARFGAMLVQKDPEVESAQRPPPLMKSSAALPTAFYLTYAGTTQLTSIAFVRGAFAHLSWLTF
jgi:hypothetical protein